MPDDKRAHETADRLAEEFGRDCKKLRVFKHDDGNAHVVGQTKRYIPPDEFSERAKKALEE